MQSIHRWEAEEKLCLLLDFLWFLGLNSTSAHTMANSLNEDFIELYIERRIANAELRRPKV